MTDPKFSKSHRNRTQKFKDIDNSNKKGLLHQLKI